MREIKLLLVDDEKDFIKTLSERLNMRELKSDTAFSGEEAMAFVDDKGPDIMILDLKMPGIDGMEVLRRVKQKYPDIQVIILTGHGSDRDEEEARRIGVFDYLKKPVDIDLLVDRIKRAHKLKFQQTMSAVAFAEAGEPEMAREMLKDEDKDE